MNGEITGLIRRSGTGPAEGAPSEQRWRHIASGAASKHEPGRCEMTAAPQLAVTRLNVIEAQCEALFASALQPSDAPTADMVAEAVNRTVQQFGIGDCIGRMAQEFGDHPDTAAKRMRWTRRLITCEAARP
jgi:hypothetical protein